MSNGSAAVGANPRGRRFRWLFSPVPRIFDALVMAVLPRSKDWFAKARGLRLTMDGIHWSSLSARAAVVAVDEAIANINPASS